MLIEYNPDDYEVVSQSHTCGYHEKNPGKPWAGCTCSGSHGLVRKKFWPPLGKPEPLDLEFIALLKKF